VDLRHALLQRLLQRLKQVPFRSPYFIAASALLCSALIYTAYFTVQHRHTLALFVEKPALDALPVVPQNMRWGFALDQFSHTETELKRGDILGSLLLEQGLDYPKVAKLVDNCKGKFNISSLRMGRKLHFLAPHASDKPCYMVYEPSPYEYAVFQLVEPFQVQITKRDIHTEVVAASGVLESSFWQALTDNGLSDELADGMIDILASSVDFYHQKQGDRFKVVFEQHIVEGEKVGTGKILAALYEREGKEYYAFNFQHATEKTDYFDFDGRPARKAFLKAPVKVSRISSRYNLNRLHPVLGYHKAHLGTDYAAPHGTPIIAVASGTVTEATRRGGNGNFVRIRHDGTYETQYLHMSGFAKGVRAGTRVVQGQTIGYVGSTGLATGPHVCFRFWKNGVQVDHLRLNLPQPEPIKGAEFQRFTTVRDQLMQLLNSVRYRSHEEIAQESEGNADGKLMKVEP
jgi:murein DD-endopeptidase MepM/ murein hydrolase activator NlpD